MTTIDRETVVMAVEHAGLDEDALREGYSGRGMYGKDCLGIICSAGEALMFAASLGSLTDDWDWVGDARSDSMGLGTIWYWPGVQLETS